MAPLRNNSSERTKHQRGRIACKQCRQSKVKCGLIAAPCGRCRRLGLECSWDPTYKRPRTNDRFSTLENQVRELQNHTEQRKRNDVPIATLSSSNEESDAQAARLLQGISVEHLTQAPQIRTAPLRRSPSHYETENVKITTEEVDRMFTTYFEKFHPHLPFMDPGRTPEECYNLNKFLFWMVIAVAARETSPGTDFVAKLSGFLEISISKIINDSGFKRLCTGHVQALLLMALWPPLNIPFCGDRCIMLANLALTISSNYGFHNPHFEQEYERRAIIITPTHQTVRIMAWAACVAVVQNLSIDFGTPVLAPFHNWKITELCSSVQPQESSIDMSVPIDLIDYLRIQRISNGFYNRLPEQASKAFNDEALLDVLVSSEGEAEQSIAFKNLSLLNRIRYLGVMLHVRCMYFMLNISSLSRKSGILRAYQTATDLLTLVVSEDGSRDIVLHAPRMTLRMIFHAACVVFLVLHSSYRHEVDYTAGKILARATEMCFALQTAGYEKPSELPYRYADVLRELWRLYESDHRLLSSPPYLMVRTRFAANVVYHCFALFYNRAQYRATQNNRVNEEADHMLTPASFRNEPDIPSQDLSTITEPFDFSLDALWASGLDDTELFSVF